jgi:hypothetical protein
VRPAFIRPSSRLCAFACNPLFSPWPSRWKPLHPDPPSKVSQERRRQFKNLDKNVFGLATHPVAKLEVRMKPGAAIRAGHQDPADVLWKSQLLAAFGAGSDCIVCHLSVHLLTEDLKLCGFA